MKKRFILSDNRTVVEYTEKNVTGKSIVLIDGVPAIKKSKGIYVDMSTGKEGEIIQITKKLVAESFLVFKNEEFLISEKISTTQAVISSLPFILIIALGNIPGTYIVGGAIGGAIGAVGSYTILNIFKSDKETSKQNILAFLIIILTLFAAFCVGQLIIFLVLQMVI